MLPSAGAPSDLVNTPESKLRPPAAHLAMVRRRRLLERLADSRYQIVAIQAPGGFGKSTLAAQLAEQSVIVAWATLDATDSDPVVLVSTLLNALADAQALTIEEPGTRWPGGLSGDEPVFSRWVLPQFRRAVESTSPVTIVIDDAHRARGSQARAVLVALVESLPRGSSIALVGRALGSLPLSVWHGQGRLLQIDSSDLLFDDAEIEAALTGFHGSVPSAELVRDVAARTDGWPVAVYLGAISDDYRAYGVSDDLRQYFRNEILSNVDSEVVDFLRRSAPLEALSAPVCKAVIDGIDAVGLLRRAESESLLISRMEGRTQWFRLHTFLREQLLDELTMSDPVEARLVHARASRWYDEQGLVDQAILHATAAGDPQVLGSVLWPAATDALLIGQAGRVRRWLAEIDEPTIAMSSGLSVAAAWTAVVFGEYPAAMRWAAASQELLGPDWRARLDNSTVEPAFGLLVALSGAGGWDDSAELAQGARAVLPTENSIHVFADLCCGLYALLRGEVRRGLQLLEEARILAAARSMATTQVEAAALAALIHAEAGELQLATDLSQEAQLTWNTHHREGSLTTTAIVENSAALVAALNHDVSWAEHLAAALDLAPVIAPVLPWFEVVVHSIAARCLAQHDETGAMAHLATASEALQRGASSPFLAEAVAVARRTVTDGQTISVLSPAERRVWRMLQGRRTMKEIADALFLSPETVKSHTASIYRKLHVSSRREAQELGEALTSDIAD